MRLPCNDNREQHIECAIIYAYNQILYANVTYDATNIASRATRSKIFAGRCFLRVRYYGKWSIRKKQGKAEKMELRLHKKARLSLR
jgi:hypothetical protein